MALNSRGVSLEEIQNMQQVLWRNSSDAKTSIREAASRLLEHVRSRELFLLEQVEMMERTKMESLVEGIKKTDDETCLEELVSEVTSLKVDLDSSFRPLCDSISKFGQIVQDSNSFSYDDLVATRQRHASEGESSIGSDFSIIEDEKQSKTQLQKATSLLSDWLLDSASSQKERRVASFLGNAHFDRDFHFWLSTSGASPDASLPTEMKDVVEDGGWDTWLHPLSSQTKVEDSNHFSEYFRILSETSGSESWLLQPQTTERQTASAPSLAPAAAPTTLTSDWLHPAAPRPRTDCVTQCRIHPLPMNMEIENLAVDLTCLSTDDADDNPWIFKPAQVKTRPKARPTLKTARRQETRKSGSSLWDEHNVSDWLIGGEETMEARETSGRGEDDAPFSDWLLSSADQGQAQGQAQSLAKMCIANEPCAGFGACLADVNCKKGRKTGDDEEKEKEDDQEKEGSMDDEADDWNMCDDLDQKNKKIEGQEKLATILKQMQLNLSQPEDYWLST